ncbi:MAG: hypothetical protein KBC16_00180 [Candidatus Pacebacteria bacterium]|nr:hypothetical protein [Candidatus Paceibacterota bacterium]
MKKLIAILIVVLIAGAGVVYVQTQEVRAPEATITTETPSASEQKSPGSPISHTIIYDGQGFSPTTLTVKAGETVTFVNQSTRGMWVGADEHPTHTSYDGSSTSQHCGKTGPVDATVFDQCIAVQNGGSWSFTFTKVGSFDFHNHVAGGAHGTVVVE